MLNQEPKARWRLNLIPSSLSGALDSDVHRRRSPQMGSERQIRSTGAFERIAHSPPRARRRVGIRVQRSADAIKPRLADRFAIAAEMSGDFVDDHLVGNAAQRGLLLNGGNGLLVEDGGDR